MYDIRSISENQYLYLKIFQVFAILRVAHHEWAVIGRNEAVYPMIIAISPVWIEHMNRKDFGHLVAALRREHLDNEGKQWTQERLAQEAQIDSEILGNIERGKRAYLKADMLLSLANALQLTNEERKEFFLAAHAFEEPEAIYQGEDEKAILHQLVQRVEHVTLPAYLIDNYCDILACNQTVLNLLGLTPEHLQKTSDHPIVAANMMRFVFAPEFDQRASMPSWHTYAYQNITIFRTLSLRYRTQPYFQALITELRKWPLFRRYWFKLYEDIERDPVVDNETIVVHAPQVGELNYFSTSLTAMTGTGSLVFYAYIPADARTTEIFTDIARHSEQRVYQFGSWPDKKVPHL
jgi:transcriptional regulator with XRE-family HTH domain